MFSIKRSKRSKRQVTQAKRFNSNDFVLENKVKTEAKRLNSNKCILKKKVKRPAKTIQVNKGGDYKYVSSRQTCPTEEQQQLSQNTNPLDFDDRSANEHMALTTAVKNKYSILSTMSGACLESGKADQHMSENSKMSDPTDSASNYPGDMENIKSSQLCLVQGDHQDDVEETDNFFQPTPVDESGKCQKDCDQDSIASTENSFMSLQRDSLPQSTKDLDDQPNDQISFDLNITEDFDDQSVLEEHSNNDLVESSSVQLYQTMTKRPRLNLHDDESSEEIMEPTKSKNEIPASFTISLTKAEWKTIKPKKKDPNRKLCSSWTDLFSEKMADGEIPCVLQFYYNRIKRPDSRKINARYFHGKAKCKFETCTWYTFEISEKPVKVSKNGVTIKVKKHGEIKHPRFQIKRRQLRGERRQQYKQKLKTTAPSNLHYELLEKLSQSQFDGGNHTIPSTKHVLRQIKYEMKKEDYLHEDEWKEVVLTSQILRECDQDSNSVLGYIQFLSYQPFITICFTETQLRLYIKQKKLARGVLHLDATGSLVKKQQGSEKPVYYYAAVLKNNKPKEPPMPIAEMFTNEHTTTIISLFLGKLKQDLMTISTSWHSVQPTRIEVDFSWPLINSILVVCNQENIHAYLSRAWEIATKSKAVSKFTKVHLCSAHLVKRVHDRLGHATSDKGLADFCTFAFALLQNSFELRQAKSIYVSLCTILDTEYETTPVKEAIAKIEQQIIDQKTEIPNSVHTCPQEVNHDHHHENSTSTIKALSPFNKFFENVKKNAQTNSEHTCQTRNKYFNKEALAIIESYLHLYPLWSGMLLRNERDDNGNPITRDTNCFVENWFRIVKQNILNKKQSQRPGPVIRLLHKSIRGRSREFQNSMESKITQTQDLSLVESAALTQDGIDIQREQWRQQSKQKTSKFYTSPSKMPGPKLSEINIEKKLKPKQGQKRSYTSLMQGVNTEDMTSHEVECNNNSWMRPLLQAIRGWLPTSKQESGDGILDQFLNKLVLSTFPSVLNPGALISDFIRSPEYAKLKFREENNTVTFLHQFLQRMQQANLFKPILMKKALQCQLCGTTNSTVQERISTLMIHLTAPTVQKCIDAHFNPTTFLPSRQQCCTKCEEFTDHFQNRTVVDSSDAMVIILKRFTESPQKQQVSVVIEKKISLNSETDINCDYNLRSMQLHHGNSVHSEHYTAILITPKGIISFDGETVTEEGQDYLQSQQTKTGCYVLFYEKTKKSKQVSKNLEHSESSTAKRRQLLRLEDMRTLEPRTWLNDKIVNAYMTILEEKYPVHCFDSFFLEEIKRSGVRNMTQDINTTEVEFLFIPLHQQTHWSLIVVDVKKATLSYLDPLGIVNETTVETVSDYLKQNGLKLKRDKHLENCKTFPTQKNTFDCGVYILEYARCIASHQRCKQVNLKKGRDNIKQSLEEVYPVQMDVTDD